MNIIAYAFIALGYTLAYWGANNIKHWDRSVQNTEAAPMTLLFGFPAKQDTVPIHPIPFPFTSKKAASTGTGDPLNPGYPVPYKPKPTTPPANGGLSPTYPGAPGSTIPTPPVRGTSYA